MPSKESPVLRQTADSMKARQAQPCVICRQRIDYRLPADHPDAFSLEHIKPRSTHPHLENDPANLAPAHSHCNKSRGNRDLAGLGETSRDW